MDATTEQHRELLSLQAARARAGAAVRRDPGDDSARRHFEALQAECRALSIAEYIATQVAKEPPLTADQRQRLALLFASPSAKQIAA